MKNGLKKLLFILLAVLFTSFASSCGQLQKTGDWQLDSSRITMRVGDTARLSISFNGNKNDLNITWNSDNESVVSISEDGKLNAVGVGNAVVTAKDANGIENKCDVTVEEVPIEAISLNKKKVEIKTNETVQLQATITPENATNQDLSWISDDDSVAVVNSEGLVTGKRNGTINITCKGKNGKEASCTVVVKNENNSGGSSSKTGNDNVNVAGVSGQDSFYGIWCSASKSKSEADKKAQELRNKGFDTHVFLTTDWSNLNKEQWYVVSAGMYSSEKAAKAELSKVQKVYPNAYVKYSGNWQGR